MRQRRHVRTPWSVSLSCLLFCASITVRIGNGFALNTRPRNSQRISSSPTTVCPRFHGLCLVPQQLGSFQEIDDDVLSNLPKQDRRVRLLNYVSADNSNQPIPFEEMWNVQKEMLEAHCQRLASTTDSSQFLLSKHASTDQQQQSAGVDTIIFLQHEPVYTLGTGSDPAFIRNSESSSDVPVIRMDRGGEVTYHGPGQLVVYLILDLRSYRTDIHWYIRALEEVIIRALTLAGVHGAGRNDDTTGVWVNDHKVAAIGVKCRKWITMHGIAINVDERSLPNFEGIVPCGLEGRKVGCINQFLGAHPINVADLCVHIRAALEEVFHIQLIEG